MGLSRGLAAVAALAGTAALAAPAALAGDGAAGMACTGGLSATGLTLTCTTSTDTYSCQAARTAAGAYSVTCSRDSTVKLSCAISLFPRLTVTCPVKP